LRARKGYPHSMMILAYLRMKFSSLKMNSDLSLSVARQPRRSSSAAVRPPPPPAIDPPTGTASRTCLRAPVAARALTAALRLLAPGTWSSTSASSPSDTIECCILDQADRSPYSSSRFTTDKHAIVAAIFADDERRSRAAETDLLETDGGKGESDEAFNFVVAVAIDDEDASLGCGRLLSAAGTASVTEYRHLGRSYRCCYCSRRRRRCGWIHQRCAKYSYRFVKNRGVIKDTITHRTYQIALF